MPTVTNSNVNSRLITFKALDEFINQLKVAKMLNTDWAKEFGQKGRKIGDTLLVRKPQRFLVRDGAAYQGQPLVDTYATVTINKHKQIGFEQGAFETTLDLDDIYNRYFKKAITQLANQVDDDCIEHATLRTNNIVGILGTDPSTTADVQGLFTDALAILMENGCDTDGLKIALGPRQNASLINYLTTMFNPAGQQSRLYKDGMLGERAFGFEQFAIDQNIRRFTVGTFVGTPLVATTSVAGATTLATNGWTSGDVIVAGTSFTVAATNNVNPKNRRSTGVLKRIVNLTTQTAGADGLLTLQISPALYDADDQYASVDALPVAAAALTLFPGTSSPSGKAGWNGLALHRDAFAFCPIKLPMMPNLEVHESVTDPSTGISMAIHAGWDIKSYERIDRIDIGYGIADLYPDNCAVRILTA